MVDKTSYCSYFPATTARFVKKVVPIRTFQHSHIVTTSNIINLGHVCVGANIGLIFEKFLVGDANLNYFVCLLFIYQVQEVQKSRAFLPMATTTIAIL